MTLHARLAQSSCTSSPPCVACLQKAQGTLSSVLINSVLTKAVIQQAAQAAFQEDYIVGGAPPAFDWDQLDPMERQGYRRIARVVLESAFKSMKEGQ